MLYIAFVCHFLLTYNKNLLSKKNYFVMVPVQNVGSMLLSFILQHFDSLDTKTLLY